MMHMTDEFDLTVVLAQALRYAARNGSQEKVATLIATLTQTVHVLRETTPVARVTSAGITHVNGAVDETLVAGLLPEGFTPGDLDPLSRILNAGLDLARRERDGQELDAAELQALECCDDIGGVRGVAADEGLGH